MSSISLTNDYDRSGEFTTCRKFLQETDKDVPKSQTQPKLIKSFYPEVFDPNHDQHDQEMY